MENISTFNSISQRILFAFQFSYSEFEPVTSDIVSMSSQKQLHKLLSQIQDHLYANPKLLSLPMDADRAYPQYLCNNEIPELDKIYQVAFKALYEFYCFMYVASFYGEVSGDSVTVPKELLKTQKAGYKSFFSPVLSTVGINVTVDKVSVALSHMDGDKLFPAMKLLASNNYGEYEMYNSYPPMSFNHNLLLFASCSFNGNLDYLLKRVDDLYDYNGLLLELKADCINKGYVYLIKPALMSTDFTFCIQLRNSLGGFFIAYSPRREWKVSFGTLNGIGEKAMLEDFDSLDDDMKEYFLRICKPCNGCLFCTKGGKNKPFTTKVSYQGKEYSLCPMFPNHCWNAMDRILIDRLLKYHNLQEEYAR